MNQTPAAPASSGASHLNTQPVNSMLNELEALRALELTAANALVYFQAMKLTWKDGTGIIRIAEELATRLEVIREIRCPRQRRST